MPNRPLILGFVLVLISSLAFATSYNLVLKLENESIILTELSLVDANQTINAGGAYTAKVVSFKDIVLYEKSFDFTSVLREPPKEWFDENGTQIINKTNQTIGQPLFAQILLPYFRNGKSINIYRNSTKLDSFSISKFAVCNENNVCEPALGENYAVCSGDCSSGSKDGFCDGVKDGKCDADCLVSADIDCKLPETGSTQTSEINWLLIGVIALAIIIAVAIILKLLKKI
jgi:hypothetical protein